MSYFSLTQRWFTYYTSIIDDNFVSILKIACMRLGIFAQVKFPLIDSPYSDDKNSKIIDNSKIHIKSFRMFFWPSVIIFALGNYRMTKKSGYRS